MRSERSIRIRCLWIIYHREYIWQCTHNIRGDGCWGHLITNFSTNFFANSSTRMMASFPLTPNYYLNNCHVCYLNKIGEMAQSITITLVRLKLSPKYFVSNIRHLHRGNLGILLIKPMVFTHRKLQWFYSLGDRTFVDEKPFGHLELRQILGSDYD